MPTSPTPTYATPFGKNVFLRSTRGMKFDHATLARETVPYETIDGYANQQILQPGVALARITSGPDAGKVGPFQDAGSAANEVQTLTEGDAISAGTFDITSFLGETFASLTEIAFDITASALQALLRAAAAASENPETNEFADSLTVSGGPIASTAFTITFIGGGEGKDVAATVVDDTDLTGTIVVATGTAGVAGANDGRQTVANLVGLNNTFLPWTLIERDVEVAYLYDCAAVQANCLKLSAAGLWVPLDDTTAAAMVAKKTMNITFHVASTEI